MRFAGSWRYILAIASCCFAAQMVQAQTNESVQLTPGFTRLVRFDRPIATVVIGNPEVADARAQTDRSIALGGKAVGITNLIARATPGIDTLLPGEYASGVRILRRKLRRWKPEVVAFVGVTVFRAVFACRPGTPVSLGLQRERFEGARVAVLPNPSGRNANFTYAEMLQAFRTLRRFVC